MERIIGQKRYNTETAEQLAETGGYILLRKRTGEMFLFHQAEKKIVPLTDDMARLWVRQHIPEAEKHIFLVEEEQNPTKRVNVTFSLTEESLDKLKEIEKRTGIKRSEIVRILVRKEYDNPTIS